MCISNKIDVLKQVAKKLNENNITWQLGASCMLYLRDYVDHFNDIDIMISKNDVQKTINIMNDFGTPVIKGPDATCKTKVFLEYRIDEVDIDIMSGLIIVNQGKDHYFPLHSDETSDLYPLDGVQIKLARVDAWLCYYTLMDRTDKVELISRKRIKHQNRSD